MIMKFSENAQIICEIHYIKQNGKKGNVEIELPPDFKDEDFIQWVEWVPKKKIIQVIQ